jgi:hypothetical protein
VAAVGRLESALPCRCAASLKRSMLLRQSKLLQNWLCHADARQVSDLPDAAPFSPGLRPGLARFFTCQNRYDGERATHDLERRSLSVHNSGGEESTAGLSNRRYENSRLQSDRRSSNFMWISVICLRHYARPLASADRSPTRAVKGASIHKRHCQPPSIGILEREEIRSIPQETGA